MSYEPGTPIKIYMDTLPANITPLPDGVPAGYKLRIVVTESMITVLWLTGTQVGRFDIEVPEDQLAGFSYTGGQAGEYFIAQAGGCGCGMALLKSYRPFPSNTYVQSSNRPQTEYGVPPVRPARWSRFSG